MRKPTLHSLVAIITILALYCIYAQPSYHGDMNHMRDYHPYHRSWNGRHHYDVSIPKVLPTPKSKMWIKNLREVLSLEKLSKLQYQADSDKFRIRMPYRMVILQENNHIDWITRLLKAYKISTRVSIPKIKSSKTITQAYRYAMELESNLIPKYELLMKNAEDNTAIRVLDIILNQTKMHYDMFRHALSINRMH